MQVSNLSGVKPWLVVSPLSTDPFWSKEVERVTEIDIQFFYARASLLNLRVAAREAIDRLQAAVILGAIEGEISHVPDGVLAHEQEPEPFFVDELIEGLKGLSFPRRLACLFSLEVNQTLEYSLNLTWPVLARQKNLNSVCLALATEAGRTRHLKLPYVFWEWLNENIAAPLLELEWSVENAFRCTWPQLVLNYKALIWIDRPSDARDLLTLLSTSGDR